MNMRLVSILIAAVAALGMTVPVFSATAENQPKQGGLGLLGGTMAQEIEPISAEERERARNYFTDTLLTTQDGEKVRFYSDLLDGNIVMINVIYTSCQGACPMQTQKLSQVSRDLGELYGKDIRFVSLSNDAERDTPEALKEFAKKQGVNEDGWTFLTGPKQEIDAVIHKLGLYTKNFEQHTALLLIGNTRTGHWKKVKPHTPYQAITLRLRQLASEG